MKRLFLLTVLLAAMTAVNAKTYNYLCAISDISVDTLASNQKNQFTVSLTQVCKNTAEYDTKPEGTYTTTLKLVLNSDDRTLDGTYTTEGADPDKSGANVNDQTINLVTSELYYGNTRRLLRSDSISTFTITQVDATHYAISTGRLCFTAAALQNRYKDTYVYNYCYAEEDILTEGISPTPYVFGFTGEYEEQAANYDMTVNGLQVEQSNTNYGVTRYLLTLSCSGTCRETSATREYEVQLALYPTEEAIAGSFSTRDNSNILMATSSYVQDLKAGKLRYLAGDSVSTIQIQAEADKQYRFFGGTLVCVDLDANYAAVYGKKRVEKVHYYHFSDNGGEGVPFCWDADNKVIALIPDKVTVTPQTEEGETVGYQLDIEAASNGLRYEVFLDLLTDRLAGTFTVAGNQLSLWSKVTRNTTSSYITGEAGVLISEKSTGVYTLSGTLPCENGNTYSITAGDFEYKETATGVGHVERDDVPCTKVMVDGMLYIMYKGQRYNVQGGRVMSGEL
ncbi:MAG: hypothetical protein IKO26_07515 [Paludibacteraceae bacterium]|nr:hypothetical protein [Paludibacteraceae bacterium]